MSLSPASFQSNPDGPRAWYSAGSAEYSRRDYAGAASCFRAALERCPNWLQAHHDLGRALFNLGEVEQALDQFRIAAAAEDPAVPEAAIAQIIPGNPAEDNQSILDARRRWAERHLALSHRAEDFSRQAKTVGDRPLRVGYVSSFFHKRNWMKPVWGLINHHDRRRFKIHLFSDAPQSSIEHGYVAHSEDVFHDTTGLSNDELAQKIKGQGIDLLVDLNGYSTMSRLPLFRMRPARLVVGWFNMYATTGIASYDYLIGDDIVIPHAEEKFYCEKIVRVPGSYLTFEVTYPVPPVVDPPSISKGTVTFGSLAPQYKITGEVIRTWSRILEQVPHSSLILRNRGLVAEGVRQFVHGLFERQGISRERVRLEGPAYHYEFLETYSRIDVALDTFPYSGGATTMEAIWQGVPVVTFWGDRWASRTSASILEAASLSILVGRGPEDYVSLAVDWATSPDRLVKLRRTLRSHLLDSSVCDTRTFSRNMERIYTEMTSCHPKMEFLDSSAEGNTA